MRKFFASHRVQHTPPRKRSVRIETFDRSCPVCLNIKRLVQDHDHSNDRNRDLICSRCNFLVGRAEHDGERPAAPVAAYLRRWARYFLVQAEGERMAKLKRRKDSENRPRNDERRQAGVDLRPCLRSSRLRAATGLVSGRRTHVSQA